MSFVLPNPFKSNLFSGSIIPVSEILAFQPEKVKSECEPQGSACAEPTLISKILVPLGSGFHVGTPKSGFQANWVKLDSVTKFVLKCCCLKWRFPYSNYET